MVLTVEQVANKLQLPAPHIRKLIRDGILPGFKRTKRLWGMLLSKLERWIAGQHNQTGKDGGK